MTELGLKVLYSAVLLMLMILCGREIWLLWFDYRCNSAGSRQRKMAWTRRQPVIRSAAWSFSSEGLVNSSPRLHDRQVNVGYHGSQTPTARLETVFRLHSRRDEDRDSRVNVSSRAVFGIYRHAQRNYRQRR